MRHLFFIVFFLIISHNLFSQTKFKLVANSQLKLFLVDQGISKKELRNKFEISVSNNFENVNFLDKNGFPIFVLCFEKVVDKTNRNQYYQRTFIKDNLPITSARTNSVFSISFQLRKKNNYLYFIDHSTLKSYHLQLN